jgi:DNA-binding NarL/FixJ family response regulator
MELAISDECGRTSRIKLPFTWRRIDEATYGRFSNSAIAIGAEFPTLTRAEIRVAALIRLALSSCEIALVLGVTERAIENHRWKIRKKLGLKPGQSIYPRLMCVQF